MITLSSDFGSPYPAAMKGVILRQCDARLVDVAHDLPRQDVRAAAFWLRFVLPEFPRATHLAVVDPGVGTDRGAVVVRAGGHAIVAPDNGLALPAARALAADAAGTAEDHATPADTDVDVFEYAYADPASRTFHGRDVFAPAAAAVHEVGVSNVETLPAASPTDDYVDLRFPDPRVSVSAAEGEVLVVDDFGNVVTNVPGDVLAGVDSVAVNGERVPVGPSFAAVPEGDPLVTVGSHGYVECDVNHGRGDEYFGLGAGDAVRFEW